MWPESEQRGPSLKEKTWTYSRSATDWTGKVLCSLPLLQDLYILFYFFYSFTHLLPNVQLLNHEFNLKLFQFYLQHFFLTFLCFPLFLGLHDKVIFKFNPTKIMLQV